ncbi:MAG TPA: hypothetical protein V6D48_05015, partial [Oculatellaceae cyanobacterium]
KGDGVVSNPKFKGDNAMVWFILMFLFVLALSATPLLGSLKVRWSLEVMIGLFAAFFVAGWVILIFYPVIW